MTYMRPRRRRGDGGNSGQSLDSLLDTMTNVVGILVIVLVVTLLGVRDAVKRIDASLPDVSQEQLDAQKVEAAKTAELLKNVLNKQDAGPKEPLPDVDALKKKLAAPSSVCTLVTPGRSRAAALFAACRRRGLIPTLNNVSSTPTNTEY